jgi:hypothetical protein
LLAVLGAIILPCRDAAAEQRILKWEVEGTVVEVEDPDKIFTSVRLGDPVSGFLSYDTAGAPTWGDDLYEFQPFIVVGFVIENPRDDTEIEFVADTEILAYVEVIDDREFEGVEPFDGISALQSVVLPEGWSGFAAAIWVDLYGPPDILSGKSLPKALDLDDWPDATISFYDAFFFSGGPNSYVTAEIHTLTPVILPIIPGDFNSDGVIDAADYAVWRDGLGTTYTESDYETWRTNFGKTSADADAVAGALGNEGSTNVPEPATLMLIPLGLLILCITKHKVSVNSFHQPGGVRTRQPIDALERIVPTTSSGGITEYAMTLGGNQPAETPGSDFLLALDNQYIIEIGFGTGDRFVRARDVAPQLKFDSPGTVSPSIQNYRPIPPATLPALELIQHQGDALVIQGRHNLGNFRISSFATPSLFVLPLDVPDLPLSARAHYTSAELAGLGDMEIPITIRMHIAPEPATLALISLAGMALIGTCPKRRR